MAKRKKMKLSAAERARRAKVARINFFGKKTIKAKTRRVKYMAKRKSKKSSKGLGRFGGLLSMDNVLRGVGAGASGVVVAMAGRFIPVGNPALVKIIAPVIIASFAKNKTITRLAEGVVISGIADLTGGFTSGMLANVGGVAAPANNLYY